MIIQPLDDILVRPIVDLALTEDLGRAGDITGQACIDPDARLSVVWASRQDGRVSGLACARLSLAALDPTATFEVVTPDGSDVLPGTVLAKAEGNARGLGHPGRQGAEEGLIQGRDGQAQFAATGLILLETPALLGGIGQFGKPIGQFHPLQVELEAFGNRFGTGTESR